MTDEDRIRERAHRIWEEEGRPHGRHEEHWQRARREILGNKAPPNFRPGEPGAAEDIPSQSGGLPGTGISDRMGVDELGVAEDQPGPNDTLPAGTLRKRLLP